MPSGIVTAEMTFMRGKETNTKHCRNCGENDHKSDAQYFWKGNDDAGEGYQELVSANSYRVEIDLVFLAPFESTAHTYFELEEENNATLVKWGFDSEMPRPLNLLSLVYDLETEIGKDYNKGLQNLKSKVEGLQE